MASPRFVDISQRMILSRYGGYEGLVYYGLKLAALTPEQQQEYFALKREKAKINRSIRTAEVFKNVGLLIKTYGGPELSEAKSFADVKTLMESSVQYKQIVERLAELEKIMDEKVQISKEEFLKQLYL